MRPPITEQPSKATQRNLCEIPLCLVRRALAPLTPKTLKMSAYGTLSPYCATPRVLPTPWALPTPAFATWQGCRGKPPAPLPQTLGRLQPVKAKPQAVASQALTGFQLHPLRIVLLLSRRWRGVKGGEAVHFTLDALEPTQHFATGSGGWVLTACPCGACK